ncbi:response regulator [Bacillus lacus]|uniref:Response regulator n=1 Tax=Metabacillus lacus TaxID=1983721 RepID=A0A7X2J2Z4_9BACI|nr:response regulator [Metabacillus lacus]MRX74202.1 response regulator [Metabacillus lacus]
MNQKTILIVDDEPNTRRGLKKTLETWSSQDLEIVSAEDGAEAISIIKNKRVHLLITDISMPEISGLQLVKEFKEINKDAVTIIVSAYPEFDYAQEAIQLGVLSYLLKPVSKDVLIGEVEKALEIDSSREKAGLMTKVMDEKLIEAERDNAQEETVVAKVVKYIEEHLHEQITLRDAASYVHLNASYLSVLFKDKVKMNFSEYVTRKRLQKAKNMLLSTNLSINEIAEAVGYKTAKYFIKIFKEHEGSTPSQYRRTK